MYDQELIDLLSLEIPEKPTNEDGFLEIIRSGHKENINSRVYEYFLSQKNNSRVANVFIGSLLEIANTKGNKDLVFESYECVTEEVTIKGNRIDLLIVDNDNKSALIIENKLYHHLDNDLIDYWNHLDFKNGNKVGILLTLSPHKIPPEVKDYFINVTHWEWISVIKAKGIPSGLSTKQYVYLNDFFNTIENMTTNYEMNDQALFYFQHTKKLLKAYDTVNEANKFLKIQLELLASKLGLSTYGNSLSWCNLWDEENHRYTFYTIVFDSLLKGGGKISVIIELEKQDKEKVVELDKVLSDDPMYKRLNRTLSSNGHYIHFLKRDYKLDLEQIQNFSETVLGVIQEDFEPIMIKIMNRLYPNLSDLSSKR